MFTIESRTWDEVRGEVTSANPKLAELIDQINHIDCYPLIKARYAFGDSIVKNGIFQIPNKQGVVSIAEAKISSSLKRELSYSQIPLFLLLKKSSEVFIQSASRSIPLNLFRAGSLLGLFESVNEMFNNQSNSRWCVTAGCRSLFMLPKVTTVDGFNRLRIQYGLPSSLSIKSHSDHWKVFAEIAKQVSDTDSWYTDILIFPKKWIEKKDNVSWFMFREYIFQHAWHQSQFALEKVIYNFLWHSFTESLNAKNLRPKPYLTNTVKHLLAIASGVWPGFVPAAYSTESAEQNSEVAPISTIQKAFLESYRLKKYAPTIMHPALLSHQDGQSSVFYSLAFPTLLEDVPKDNKNSPTIMSNLRQIKYMIDTWQRHPDNTKDLPNKVNFRYFHTGQDVYGEIKSSETIPNYAPSFVLKTDASASQAFCASSSFWHGCVQLSLENMGDN